MVYSQSMNTQSAFNYLKEANRAKNQADKLSYLEKAKSLIDEASVNPETSADAKTFFYKGIIYMTYFRAKGDNNQDLLKGAVEALKKAYEFDTKKKYSEEILVNVDTLRQSYYTKGVEYFKTNKFNESMESFEQGASLFQVINQVDTALLLTAAVAAEKAERYDKARDYYETVLKSGNNSASTYYGLGVFYTKLKDKQNAQRIISKGRELYPKNLELIKAETNMYLAFGEDEKAMEQLQLIAKDDTGNSTVFYAIGSLQDKIANDTAKSKAVRDEAFTKAIASYDKAIALDPNYFNAYYSAGILYNNAAAELLTKANNLPSDAVKEYEKMTGDAEASLDKALPYLEKAHQIDPKDESTLIALKQIYVRKKQTDKAKAINEELNNLKK